MQLEEIFKNVKAASKSLTLIKDETRNEILQAVAEAILAHKEEILAANRSDLSRMDKSNKVYDRLLLNDKRLEDIAADMHHVATLPSPLGKTLKEKTLENGLNLKRVSVPFGVIGMIYESRPNVTFDVFSLCFKSGNACILKGSKDADDTNRAEVKLIHNVLKQYHINTNVVELLPATHEATGELLNAVGYVDLCIPRGGKNLIKFVQSTAKVPVIETGAGIVHCYFDEEGDLTIGKDIVDNAKTRRPSVCNTLDTLIINEKRLQDLPELLSKVEAKGVRIYADAQAYKALKGKYTDDLLEKADEETWSYESMSLQMGVKTVANIDEALEHIAKYGSGHSESIITEDQDAQKKFQTLVDAACVYVNTPTSFTDGAQFGLGAEIGISTQKLGARGPMALEEITTYKWLITGHGQIRA
ncbi:MULTISPECIES: glutamate-5-semialdehyde dehydrogenase [Segatella]|jgi:glutamate-5-semialdehyde dehydrogenase|uniref:Gamma-glutamyl phosphate reductase n=2 Tax=Segatella TaxID=2974251 RepID=D8DU57_9BACT|nr:MULTISPECIES: glutamate-5-semialdehyde dehydrogenase [Segatella]EFI73002.1 glutamate-5-semialdehyde dehydrogenase [Segatella baroniae B14]UKK77755.1 glutamate-5-semialdehyde dehydrogenase [Segatella baroniae B14]SDL38430.1 glutamate-5-semialdehyde dehydrogenase [Segatella bryantii]SEP93065.1 glutamate-5-semialdehyde dehydrogenase [Segatella baroniae B14]GJG27978.1 gamma-glutamyl phosphate reductase [Segatella bryantii]